MSSELDKLGNRLRELDGRKFKKIPDIWVRLEREIELIVEELEEEKKAKSKQLVLDKLTADLIAAKRALAEIKKKKNRA